MSKICVARKEDSSFVGIYNTSEGGVPVWPEEGRHVRQYDYRAIIYDSKETILIYKELTVWE